MCALPSFDCVRAFVRLLEEDTPRGDEAVSAARYVLDRLAAEVGSLSPMADVESPVPPARDARELRLRVEKRFPKLGMYNIASPISHSIAAAELHVGDAVDDITDIALDLYSVIWLLENSGAGAALAYLAESYRTHWGAHSRALALYLHALERGE